MDLLKLLTSHQVITFDVRTWEVEEKYVDVLTNTLKTPIFLTSCTMET
jgi:hypothetical protein